MLDGIYSEQLQTRLHEYQSLRARGYEKIERELEVKENNDNVTFKRVKKDLSKSLKEYTALKATLDKKGFNADYEFTSYSSTIDDLIKRITLSVKRSHTKLLAHNEETADKVDKYHIVKQEVRMKIYGLDMTLDEVRKEVDKYIKNI